MKIKGKSTVYASPIPKSRQAVFAIIAVCILLLFSACGRSQSDSRTDISSESSASETNAKEETLYAKPGEELDYGEIEMTRTEEETDMSGFILTEDHQFYIKWWLQGIFTDKNSRYGQAATVFSFTKDSVPASVWNSNLVLYIGFNKLNDSRISEEPGQYGTNKVYTPEAAKEMAREITGSTDEAYITEVADVGKREGDRLVFYPVGLIGDTGPFYFREITGWSVEKDKLTVDGNIEMMSGSHEVMPFTAAFSIGNPKAPMPWVFETLEVTPSGTASSSSDNTALAGWQEGYYNYLRDNYSYQDYPPAFGLLYVDNDDIPELAVGFNGTGRYEQVELFCWYNGSVKKLGDVGSFSSFSFVERGNLIRSSLPVSPFHGHTLVQKIENGELKAIFEFEVKPAENYSGNIEDNLENYMGEYGTSLKKCSESEYDTKMDSYFPSGKTKGTPYIMDGYKYRANSSDIVLLTTNPALVTF